MLIIANIALVIVARVPAIVSDVLVIFITLVKLSLSSRDVLWGFRQSKRMPLTDILLRDGACPVTMLSLLERAA